MARLSLWRWWKRRADSLGNGRRGTAARPRLHSRLSLEVYEDRCVPSTVTTLADSGPGSLRDALASTLAGGTVDFQPGLTGTITLTSGELAITKSVDIEGPGANQLTVSGDYASRVFDIRQSGLTVTIAGLEITNGFFTDRSSLEGAAQGGGIYIAGGNITLANCSLVGNGATGGNLVAGGGLGAGGGVYVASGHLVVDHSVLSANQATGGNGAGISSPGGPGQGGGIYVVSGSLDINDSTLSANQATGGMAVGSQLAGPGAGGGVYVASGSLAVRGSTFSANQATGAAGGAARPTGGYGGAGTGGGIYVAAGNVAVTDSTFAGNGAIGGAGGAGVSDPFHPPPRGGDGGAGAGGGVFVMGHTVVVTDSTFAGNRAIGGAGGNIGIGGLQGAGGNGAAGMGGGLDIVAGTVAVTDSTFAGNQVAGGLGGRGQGGGPNGTTGSGLGGGIANAATLTLTGATLSGNAVGDAMVPDGSGGGLVSQAGASTMLGNTIVAADSAPSSPDVSGPLASQGYNLIGDGSGGSGFVASDLVGTTANSINPQLGPLADNGGPTQTMALLPGSPALNAGDPARPSRADQRGVPRSGGVNIGAYQASATAFLLSAPAKVTAGVPFNLTVTAVDPFGQVAVGYTGTVTFSTTDPDPSVVLPADYAFTAADAGVHTFTDSGLGETTLRTRGAQTVVVTDTADGSITGSATVKVRHRRRHAESSGGRAAREVAAADRFFASTHEGDVGFLLSSSHDRSGGAGVV